jgi:uracil-DNA glycosylase family 4
MAQGEPAMREPKALLEWYLHAGVDEAIGDVAVDHFSPLPSPLVGEGGVGGKFPHIQAASSLHQPPLPNPPPQGGRENSAPLHHSPSAAMAKARALADSCTTLAELEAAVRAFDGLAIKKTASKTVFADGNPEAKIVIIGEAPGAQEDIQGIPFCGPSGQLLDRMLASIGLDRSSVYISNTVYWRPPGNRQPSPEETAACLPFVEKLIALVNPKLLLLAGGTATTALLQKDASISRLRGRTYDYTNPYLATPVSTLVTYHPSYLLRSPGQKRLAWNDLLIVGEQLLAKS